MEPEIKLFTIADIRAWLIDNNPPVGLTECVIAPVRAYAILNNPYVKGDDVVVATIYEGDFLAAYSACFPEKIDNKRVWWCSTLWCDPNSQGKGFGMIVVGSLMEAHEGEYMYDRWGAKETVEIFNSLGYKTMYTPRYYCGNKQISLTSVKGKLAYCLQYIKILTYRLFDPPIESYYTLKYNTFIDGEAYCFIKNNKKTDLWIKSQEMYNWIVRYPFMQSCIELNKVEKDTAFSSNVNYYNYSVVKVYVAKQLVGVYVVRNNTSVVSILFLFYLENHKNSVFASIVNFAKKLNITGVLTENNDLALFIKKYRYFPKYIVEQISMTIPESVNLPENYTIQMGEGDSFA